MQPRTLLTFYTAKEVFPEQNQYFIHPAYLSDSINMPYFDEESCKSPKTRALPKTTKFIPPHLYINHANR